MRRILSATLLACLPLLGASRQYVAAGYTHLAGVTPTLIQSCTLPTQVNGASSSITCTFSSAVTAGDLLTFCLANAANTALSGTWSVNSGAETFVSDFTNTILSSNYGDSCWHVVSANGGETTATFAASGLNYAALAGDEYRHTGAQDASATPATESAGATVTTPSITTTHNGDLIVANFMCPGNPAFTAGSLYTLSGSGRNTGIGGWFNQSEYKVQPAAGPVTASVTLSTSQTCIAWITSYQN